MLTADVHSLPVNSTQYLWIIEVDQDRDRLPVLGRAGIHPWRDSRNRLFLSSDTTGVSYSCPFLTGDVELWTESRWLMAVFPDETRLLAGEHVLAAGNRMRLPPRVQHALGAAALGGIPAERVPGPGMPGGGHSRPTPAGT